MNSVLTDNMMMTLNTSNRSISPMTPSPSREVRGIRLFRAISKRLARRSTEDLNSNADTDSRSSSSDSSSSAKKEEHLSADSGFRSVSPNHMSSSSSDAGSDIQVRPRHHHSTSAESIRRAFQNLNLNGRSQSCNNTKETKRKSKKSTPKRILRSPVAYTYVKGLSGLPTQRIPKHQARMYTHNPCGGCSIQYMAGLNR